MRKKERHNEGFIKALKLFLNALRRRRFSEGTIKRHRWSLTHFFSFLAGNQIDRFQDVTLKTINKYRTSMVDAEWKANTVDANLRSVRSFFGLLADQCLLFENPAQSLILGRVPQALPKILNEGQVKTLLATPDITTASGLRDRAIIEILYSTGMRRAELAAFTLFDLDLDRKVVRVFGKGSKERLVPLGKHAVTAFREYINRSRPQLLDLAEHPTDALWLNHNHRQLSEHMVSHIVRQHAKAIGLQGVGPHTLRRSCATHMLRNGAQPMAIARLLGHADLKTLSHYLRLNITDLKKMHAKSKLGK